MLVFIFGMAQAFANSEKAFLCLSKEAPRVKKFYDHLDGTDKFKHCGVSCSLGMKCGINQTMLLGFAKELLDLLGPGNAELKDIEANMYGLTLVIAQDARDEKDCESMCFEAYRY